MFYLARDFASTSFAAMTSPRGISRFSETLPRENALARRDEAPLRWTNLQNFTRKHTHARIKEYLAQKKRFRKDAENTNHPFFVTESSVSFRDRILLSVFFARSRAQISRIFSRSRGGKNSKIGEIFSSFRIRTRERAFVPSSRENNDYDGSVSWRCFLCLDNPR